MGKESRLWKWLAIVIVTALALWELYPPSRTLKPGIDLAGGTSLIYEIDTAGMTEQEKVNLSERVMEILKERVDPNSQFNLVWRPIGNNRLEIQMPQPPEEARIRRGVYEDARAKVAAMNVGKSEIENALLINDPDARQAALDELVRGVESRRAALAEVASAWDNYVSTKENGSFAETQDALAKYEDAIDSALGTSLPIGRLADILAIKKIDREKQLTGLEEEHPAYSEVIKETAEAYDAWYQGRGSLEDPSDLKRLLRGAGVLEFRILARKDAARPDMLDAKDSGLKQPVERYVSQLEQRGPRPKAGDRYEWFPIEDLLSFNHATSMQEAEQRAKTGTEVMHEYAGRWYVLSHVDDGTQMYGLTQNSDDWSLRRAGVTRDPQSNRPAVSFVLDPRGGLQFANVTRNNIGRQLAIFLDGVATSHATIQSKIAEHGQITGNFTMERVQEIVKKLEAGSLPARLKPTPLSENTIGPTLGARNRELGIRAALIGLIVVGVFMIAYYWLLGILADIALILNIILVLAIMALLEATFTLPGIAGLLLTVGMAVDANVLIYERIREELARDVYLKKAVKLGYEKALSTIVDANLTTLITCVILGYVGSEEVKGFALTLGFGIATSMVTALFVTRVILVGLMEAGIVKSLPMPNIIRRPNIDWLGLRRVFWPVSLVVVVVGFSFFITVVSAEKEAVLDIELLGGTSVTVEMDADKHHTIEEIRKYVTEVNPSDGLSAVEWLDQAADNFAKATVEALPAGMMFRVQAPNLEPHELDALLRTTYENQLAADGFERDGDAAVFTTKPKYVPAPTDEDPNRLAEEPVTIEEFKQAVQDAAAYAKKAATRLEDARVQAVALGLESAESTEKDTRAFELITVEPNKELVRIAILGAMGDMLKVDRPIEYTLVTDPQRAPDGMFPIRGEDDLLGQVIGSDAPQDVKAYKGGVAMVFDNLNPPQTKDAIDQRIREMRLQPQFEQYDWRSYELFPLERAEGSDELLKKVAIVVTDENYVYEDDPAQWHERLAEPEMEQATLALSAEKSLRKVTQFSPQIASGTQQRAILSIVLALLAITAYVWIRFGTMQYGLAAIVALVHDVAATLGVVTLADYLNIANLRIDLAVIAAFLTLIGYSLNDTIVVFDRIRENRGKLNNLTPNIVNNSINATLPRTLLTSLTTLLAVLFLYVMGGPGVEAFSFVLLFGVIVGTYSSLAIASPLLQNPKALRIVVTILAAMGAAAVVLSVSMSPSAIITAVVLAALIIVGAVVLNARKAAASRPATA